MTAIALTIAGSDSSGGAGIQADLKTFSALGVYGASVIAALTAQNTRGVSAVHDVPADFVAAQMDAVFDDLAVRAVKIGMLSRPEVVETVAAGLTRRPDVPVVLDPVMVAATGARLISEAAIGTIRTRLFPRAEIVTPNLPEAAALLDGEVAQGRAEMEAQARALLDLGPLAVLVKGGHGEGPEAADVLLVRGAEPVWLTAPRKATRNDHGTGCTLSSAIAAGRARGLPLDEAVAVAKRYLTAALSAADQLAVGSGHGPVHHFHALWPTLSDPPA